MRYYMFSHLGRGHKNDRRFRKTMGRPTVGCAGADLSQGQLGDLPHRTGGDPKNAPDTFGRMSISGT